MLDLLRLVVVLLLFVWHVELYAQKEARGKYSLKITEVCSNNSITYRDEKGSYDDWFELFNYGNKELSLEGLYVTNDLNNLTKYRFRSDRKKARDLFIHKNTFRVIWCDKEEHQGPRHVNFRLKPSGGFIAIVAPDGKTIIDSLTFPELSQDVSYGMDMLNRKFKYYDQPFPNRWNSKGKTRICKTPKILPRSSYQNMAKLDIEVKGEQSNVYYKYQGSDVLKKWLGNIKYDTVSSLIFVRKDSSCAKSKPVYRTYLDKSLEHENVVALAIDTTHLWHKLFGIHTGMNYKRKMRRTANFSYFDASKKMKSNANVDVVVHGAFSRTYPQKSLALKVSSDNNKKYLSHNFFEAVDHDKYRSIILRNAGNDWGGTRMKDALIQSLIDVNYLNVNVQAYTPAVVYMNGEYWGAYNIREKINSDYLKYRFGANRDKVEVLEKYKMARKGDGKQFMKLQNFIQKYSMKDPENVANLNQWIDMDNYIDYQAIQIYVANMDWPQNNVKCWRDIGRDGRWRWLIYDMDEGFRYPDFNALKVALGQDTARIRQFDSVYLRSTIILPEIMENKYLRKQLVNRFFDLMNFTFSPERVASHVDSIAFTMDAEIDRTMSYWYPKSSKYKQVMMKRGRYYETWKKNLERLKRFPERRNEKLIEHLKAQKWINETIELKLAFDPDEITLYVNGIQLKDQSRKLIYSKRYGVNIEAISHNGDPIIYPKSWKKSLNGYKASYSGEFSIKTKRKKYEENAD